MRDARVRVEPGGGYAVKPLARRLLLVTVSVVNVAVLLCFCFFGILGLRGGLSDTSVAENFRQGIQFFAIAAVVLAWSIGCFIALRRRERVKAGFCRQCGYDLRASPGRCPECGRIRMPPSLGDDLGERRRYSRLLL